MKVEGVEVSKDWKLWPMWACTTATGKPLGYVKAENKQEALEKASNKWGDAVVVSPYDGVL